MMKLSKKLKVYKVKNDKHGEVIELYSPKGEGSGAYFIDTDEKGEVGMGLRLTRETAVKLAVALIKLSKGMKIQ